MLWWGGSTPSWLRLWMPRCRAAAGNDPLLISPLSAPVGRKGERELARYFTANRSGEVKKAKMAKMSVKPSEVRMRF